MGNSGQADQLVQAMAGFDGGGDAADSLDTGLPGADASQQPFLTTPVLLTRAVQAMSWGLDLGRGQPNPIGVTRCWRNTAAW